MHGKIDLIRIHQIIPEIKLVLNRTTFKGWSLPLRTIADQELVLLISGKGSFSVEDKVVPVRPGMLFYFYPGLIHSGQTDLKQPMHFLAVHFTFAPLYSSPQGFIADKVNTHLPLEPVSNMYHPHKTQQIFEELYRIWSEKRPLSLWHQSLVFQELLFSIFNDLDHPPHDYHNLQRINQVVEYIHRYYMRPIPLEELSSLVQLSTGHFCEIFKKHMGYTPTTYIQTVRVSQAKELLLNTDMKIKDVSAAVGFKDEYYFSRIFKKIEGLSPTSFVLAARQTK